MRARLVVPALVLVFAWGYLAGRVGVFPGPQISALAARAGAMPQPSQAVTQAPQRDSYWREKASFFTTLGAHADVVMVGDSITDGADWDEMFPGVSIANRGIDGDTTDGVLERMDGILAVHAKKAFVMLGINDLSRGRDVEAVFADYRKIIERLEQSGARVYVQSTLFCRGELAKAYSCAERSEQVARLNERLAGLAAGQVVFVDLNRVLADAGGLKAELTYDGLHLNGQGYRLWKGAIASYMRPD